MFGIGERKRVGANETCVGGQDIGALPGRRGNHWRGPDVHQFAKPVDTKDPPLINATTAPTATSLATGGPDTGLRFSPLTNGKLTVSGSAQKDIVGMYVMIGPKPLGGYRHRLRERC